MQKNIIFLKKDGHVHTSFSHHGSNEKAEEYVKKAIKSGFNEISFTEHAPLPAAFYRQYAGSKKYLDESAMTFSEADDYFFIIRNLQKKYQKEIKINIGLEIDYLASFEKDTQAIIDKYDQNLEEIILSVHFMPDDKGDLWPIDGGADLFESRMKNKLKNPKNILSEYLFLVLSSIKTDFRSSAKIRVGHLSLIRKYQDYFHFPDFDLEQRRIIIKILDRVKRLNYQLDYNAAGLYKELSNQAYLDNETLYQALKKNIDITYGSDAHFVKDLGRGFEQLRDNFDFIKKIIDKAEK